MTFFVCIPHLKQYRTLDSRTRATTCARFSHKATVSTCKLASFWQEKLDAIIILVQGFAKMLLCQNKSKT